jgi:hypothetical protein
LRLGIINDGIGIELQKAGGRTAEHPPIPYVPKKDCVQETVSVFKDNHLKTQIGEGLEL